MFVFLQALMAGPNTHDGTFIHLQALMAGPQVQLATFIHLQRLTALVELAESQQSPDSRDTPFAGWRLLFPR